MWTFILSLMLLCMVYQVMLLCYKLWYNQYMLPNIEGPRLDDLRVKLYGINKLTSHQEKYQRTKERT